MLQVTVTLAEAVQPAAVSPSETVTAIVAVPGTAQVNVGAATVALLRVPELAVHW